MRGNILLILIVLIIFSACENDISEVRKVIGEESVNVETARDVELLYSDSAVVRVQLQAPLLLRHLDKGAPYEEFPMGVKVNFLDENQKPRGELTAKYAVRYEDKRQVIVRDSVVWQSGRTERLETEELIWDERKQNVFSKKFVKITKPEEVIYGYGFESNQDFTNWKIHAVEGRLKVKSLENTENSPSNAPR